MIPEGPRSRFFQSQGQRLHYLDWGNAGAPPLILVHGRRDHCRAWDWAAADLSKDWQVLAVDLRGHGNSDWAVGGLYTIPSYVYDLAELIRQREWTQVTLIGHSLGGNISLHFAGMFPEQVGRIIAIEGLGPSPERIREREATPMPIHMRTWIEERRKVAGRDVYSYATVAEAEARLRLEHPYLTGEQARHLTRHGLMRREDGRYRWRFDKFVRSFSPADLGHSYPSRYWEAITAPTLLVYGTESWTSDPGVDGRLRHFPNARVARVEGAGHWVHHDHFDEFMALVRAFLAHAI